MLKIEGLYDIYCCYRRQCIQDNTPPKTFEDWLRARGVEFYED